MKNTETIHRGIVRATWWLAPAWCVLYRRQHYSARAICAECEAAFSRNQHACHRCTLPLRPTHSPAANRLELARITAPRLCPACIKNSPRFFSGHAPYLMLIGIRGLYPSVQSSESAPAVLAPSGPAGKRFTPSGQNLGAPEGTSSQRVLVPTPTQWRHHMGQGF
jgi:hypothetical protein